MEQKANLVSSYLVDAFSKRRRVNSSYSLRAFARDLGMSSGRLNNIIHARQGVSAQWACKLTRALALNEREALQFVLTAQALWSRSSSSRALAQAELDKFLENEVAPKNEIDESKFRLISEWYHLAIIELVKTQKLQAQQLCTRLGLSRLELERAIKNLVSLGLLSNVKGRYSWVHDVVVDLKGVPSEAVRSFHSQLLNKAQEALHCQPIDKREFSNLIVSLSPEDIADIRQDVRKLQNKIMQKVSKNKSKVKSVYAFSTQLFNLEVNTKEGIQ